MDAQSYLVENAKRVVIEGHRGGRLDYENTLNAFQLAIDHGLDGVEFDIWLTKDNIPVVIHGKDEGQIGHENSNEGITQDTRVGELTLEQLKTVILPNGETIPTLEELIDLGLGKFIFNWEIKEKKKEVCQIVLDLLKLKNVTNQNLFFSSFKHYLLEEIEKLDSSFHTSYLYEPDDVKLETITLKGKMVAINHQSFSREIIEACHEKNIKVAVWFSQKHPEKTEYYQNMLELGVDTIITDRPVELKEYIAGVIASSEQLHNL